MKGKAAANGAISLVNAIASGKGATVGVELRTEATVDVIEGKGEWDISVNGEPAESPLVVETVRRAARASGIFRGECHGYARTETTFPIGVGLKSSSSASVAVALAVFAAAGRRRVDDGVVLGCSVAASLASRASITGALDDAASCLLGGVNIADNTRSKILHSAPLRRGMDVVIRVPNQRSKRQSMDLKQTRKAADVADSLIELCREGDYWAAMTLNGLVYAGLLGYDPEPSLEALRIGAVGSGLSGTGPAVAAVFDRRDESVIGRLAEAWSRGGARVIRTTTTNRRARLLG